MVEAIWGEHKSADQLARVLLSMQQNGEVALATRVDPVKAEAVAQQLEMPEALVHHRQARCLSLGPPAPARPELGSVLVLSGGSSDLPVAAEAELALRWHGIACELLLDVGVAGLHRLLDQLDRVRRARVLIACAGMEGALPTVLAGLVPQPVIAVPVSVGYGVSAGGQAALHGMLASCAPGLTVVNIDNGYGAAMAALRILSSGASAAP
ncbi:MAG: nickel pincer cofactor biosynthesis protein LarB [Cyanobacteriota bacterium]